MQQKAKGDGGSAAQKRRAAPLVDTTRARKNSSTPVASDKTTEKGAADKNKATTNRNNVFSKHTDGSMQWIPKQIVTIGEDFHSQVGDGKVRTTL